MWIPDQPLPVVLSRAKLPAGEEVDRAAAPLPNGGLEAGHEAVAEIEDERRVVDVSHVSRGELEVVRFGAGRREIPDAQRIARDLLDRVGDRVERRDGGIPRAARATRATPGEQPSGSEERSAKENDSRKHCGSLAASENRYH